MRKLRFVIILSGALLGFVFYFYSKNKTVIDLIVAQNKMSSDKAYFEALMKSPAQIVNEAKKSNESGDSDFGSRRLKNRIAEPELFQKLVSYLNANKISTEIPLCDLSKITGKDYSSEKHLYEGAIDIEDVFRLYSQYYIESHCIGTRDCDLMFKESQYSNNRDDLEFASLINSVKNYEELQNLPNRSPDILFFQALSHGNSLYFLQPDLVMTYANTDVIEPTGIDYDKSIRILENLRKAEPGNGVYSYFLIGIKDEVEKDYSRDLEYFLNSKYFYSPQLRLQRILYLQSLSSTFLAVNYLIKQNKTLPRVVTSKTHTVFKKIIPKMSDLQKKKLQQVSLKLVKLYEEAQGHFYGGIYADAENWLRRTHYKDVEALADWQRNLPKPLYSFDHWSKIGDDLSAAPCTTKTLEDLLKTENEWASRYKGL